MTFLVFLLWNNDGNVINCFPLQWLPFATAYFLKMICDVAWPTKLLSLQLWCTSYFRLRIINLWEFPVHNPGLCLQAFMHFNCLFLYLFTLLHHRYKIKIKPVPDVIVPVARFSPFSSLILKNVTVSVLVHMCYCSCPTHGQLQISLGYGFLILCLFTCAHQYLISGKYSFKIY